MCYSLVCYATTPQQEMDQGAAHRVGLSLPKGRSYQMPRYYFHVRRGQMTVVDQEGIELADNSEAVQEAERRGREIATDEAGAIIVEDEQEDRIAEIPLDID